jgi:hypothetical protein
MINCLSGAQSIISKRIYNPQGWSLPKTSELFLESEKIIKYPEIPFDILILDYARIDRDTKDPMKRYFILNNFIKPGGEVMLDSYVRQYPKYLTIYKNVLTKEVLCCFYLCLSEISPRTAFRRNPCSGEIIGQDEPVEALELFVADLDGDGKYESLFDSLFVSDNKEESLMSILKLKLGIEK